MPTPSLLAHPLLRQLGQPASPRVLATGFPRLDTSLHDGGWPLGALTELLVPQPGLVELRLLAPALKVLMQKQGWIILIDPPGLPHAPAWGIAGLPLERLLIVKPESPKDWLWSVDQAARAGQPAVLAWPGRVTLDGKSLRRLQLAAEEGGGLLMVSRRSREAEAPSPAALRLQVKPYAGYLDLNILKQRGHWGGQSISVPLPFPQVPPVSPAEWAAEAALSVGAIPLRQPPALGLRA